LTVTTDGKQRAEWVQLRKGVAYLFRYREVSLQAKQALRRLTTAKKDATGRSRLMSTQLLRTCVGDPKKASAKVGRCLRRLHAHGLIAKIPSARRCRVTHYGRNVMRTSLYPREQHSPNVYSGVMH
jgi:hypothetical protein